LEKTLDGWRRTDVEGREESGGPGNRLGNDGADRMNKNSKRAICELMQNPGVRHGANRTLVAGETGVVGVDVIRLDKSDETHKQHADEGQSSEPRGALRCWFCANQVELSHNRILRM
jgi:hypothetical protein